MNKTTTITAKHLRPVKWRFFYVASGEGFAAVPAATFDGWPHLVILVHQGSDPTLQYQTVAARKSIRLFEGFAPRGQETF